MKAYLGVTASLFGLLTAVHIWRAIVEASARDPWFIAITIASALLCVWGVRLLMATGSRANPRPG